jgi:hypothetical protein
MAEIRDIKLGRSGEPPRAAMPRRLAAIVVGDIVLGDAEHYPFNPPVVSEKITVTIK